MDNFIKAMPKIELHAHLNGSLTTDALLELGRLKYGETDGEFEMLCNSFQILDPDDLSKCFKKFQIAHDLTSTRAGLERAVKCVIRDFSFDNVVYLELRTTPREIESMTKKDYLECVLDTIRGCKSTHPNILVKLLPSIDRSQGIKSAKETIKIIEELLVHYSDTLKGIDFSGDPTKGNFSTYKEIFEEARKLNLKLSFHCGEIDNEQEIREMIDFGMDRCGHGTFIKGDNFTLIQQKQIPIECCISSNVKCKTVRSYTDHHFQLFFVQSHPVVICTDDMGVFNTTLSNEFMILHEYFHLQLSDFSKLSLFAVDVSFANKEEKEALRKIINSFTSC